MEEKERKVKEKMRMTEIVEHPPADRKMEMQKDTATLIAEQPAPEVKPVNVPAGEKKEKLKPPANNEDLFRKALKELRRQERAARRQERKVASSIPAATYQKGPLQAEHQGKTEDGGNIKTIALHEFNQGEDADDHLVIENIVEVPAPEEEYGLFRQLKELEAKQVEKQKAPVPGIENAHPDIHPAILTLGVQINQRLISGATARCVGFLLAIKRVSPPYPPPGTLIF